MSLGSDPKSLAGRPETKDGLLGQVLTPDAVAAEMAGLLAKGRKKRAMSILDPAVGPGTFPAALMELGALRRGDRLTLYDIDKEMIEKTESRLERARLNVDLVWSDYLKSSGGPYELAILNPPYVRQEWIDRKGHYQQLLKKHHGITVPGTSNLYIYFVAKVLAELAPNGRLVCIVYDSWLYTKFGKWLAGLMEANCHEYRTISAGTQPFHGRAIDATIIVAERSGDVFVPEPPNEDSTADRRSPMSAVKGFRHIDDLFLTKRGLRLKQADFFRTDLEDVKRLGATPFVKKPGRVPGYCVPSEHPEAALLLHPGGSPRKRVRRELDERLEKAMRDPEANVSVLTYYEERPDTWYLHREAPYAPILFNYYLRGRPRHILNPSRAYADNFYGLTPRDGTDGLTLLALMNSTSVCLEILRRSRNQGGGLSKIQLYEYRQAMVPNWNCLGAPAKRKLRRCGERLAGSPRDAVEVIRQIDEILAGELSSRHLDPGRLAAAIARHSDRARARRRR